MRHLLLALLLTSCSALAPRDSCGRIAARLETVAQQRQHGLLSATEADKLHAQLAAEYQSLAAQNCP